MKEYDHKEIEKKWQAAWEESQTYRTLAAAEANAAGKKPYYVLDMFPYPSGAGLHVGHPRGYIGSDVIARKKRMEGFNVLHPMGYDAFGLPAEQYAIQNHIHPREAVEKNVATFEKQLSIIGLSYDWSRKINTTDPAYYKWTQWIFLKIYDSWYDTTVKKARPISELIAVFEKEGNVNVSAWNTYGKTFSANEWNAFSAIEKQHTLMQYRLAYEGHSEVNWCAELGTVLANDEIVDGPNGPVSERGGYPVEKRQMRQWFMRITAYGDRLIEGLEDLKWPEHIKEIERNWIGKSEGSEIDFAIKGSNEKITVFTTRADTLFGVTYVVLAPEHALTAKLLDRAENKDAVEAYIKSAKAKLEIDRQQAKEKTGVELVGVKAINPANGEEVPVWIADYVLAGYGTGAVMAVPAHDERDFEFANKYGLTIKKVIEPLYISQSGFDAVRPEMPTVERDTVVAIAKHWSEDLYLCLKWKKQNWQTFVVGGTDGDDPTVASVREIREETGYQNPKFVRLLGRAHAHFFATHKNENRLAHVTGVYLELLDGQHQPIAKEEEALHEVLWLTHEQVNTFITKEEGLQFWNEFKGAAQAIPEDGILADSGSFTGLSSSEARIKITEVVGGKIVTKYKFRDAVFARQRYWGEPIPLYKNADGVINEVSEDKLPLELPDVSSYEPTGTGESPLASVPEWINAGYETNTMPGWAGSSWYFLRYIDPKDDNALASKEELAYWFGSHGVDMYIGGPEHATGHVLYARFWHKVLFDLGLVPTDEPFYEWRQQGMILAEDGRKMSKRWGNVINPDDIVSIYGADTLRLYEMFIGPFDSSLPWQTDSIIGPRRFIERVWRLVGKVIETNAAASSKEAERAIHQAIKKVSGDIDSLGFNTAVSAMMICCNELEKADSISVRDMRMVVGILAPLVPHVAEELWTMLGGEGSVHLAPWPQYDPSKLVSDTMTIVVSVNGKPRSQLVVARTTSQEEIKTLASKEEKIIAALDGKNPQRVIYVPGRLVNFVI